MITFTQQIRGAYESLGHGLEREFGEYETVYRKNFKKGFVFKEDLGQGHRLGAEDLKMVRTDDLEIYGVDIDSILGKELNTSVSKDTVVRRRYLSE